MTFSIFNFLLHAKEVNNMDNITENMEVQNDMPCDPDSELALLASIII